MRHANFAAYNFTDDIIVFDVKQYSRFKHGSVEDAVAIAKELFDRYIGHIPNTDKEFVIFPSPYHYIPSACSEIKDEFLLLLNRHLVDVGRLPAMESVVHRRLSYHTDYGKMSADEREKMIGGDKFYIDLEFIKDKFCLFLDDVRITGAHEKHINRLLATTDIDYQMIYYADYKGTDALIESRLNNAEVKNLSDFHNMGLQYGVVFNVRNIRLILTSKDFNTFIDHTSFDFKQDLYDWCIGNHFHLVPLYEKQIKFLKTLI